MSLVRIFPGLYEVRNKRGQLLFLVSAKDDEEAETLAKKGIKLFRKLGKLKKRWYEAQIREA